MKIRKSFLCLLLSAATCLTALMTSLPFRAEALETACHHITEGSNAGGQEYADWSAPVASYLTVTSGGELMRLQANASDGLYLVEYFDQTGYRYLRGVQVKAELPVFGGFYATESNYYILSGQTNRAESASVECFRLTKYDLNWKKLGSVGLYDCDTVAPFSGGSARFARDGKFLYIKTCHTMYTDRYGYNHQSNFLMQLDMERMELKQLDLGYVSHSFNQFIRMDGDCMVMVDHGDAYPRAIALMRYDSLVRRDSVSLVEFPGEEGNNITGASVGGLEVSGSAYLVAYNATVLDETFALRDTRNLFVAVMDKNTAEVTVKQITDYEEGEAAVSTPHLVKLSQNAFLLLWSRLGDVYYTKLDGNGNRVGGIYSMKGANLSDCAPVLSGNKLIWYVWKGSNITFYDIDTGNLSKNSRTEIERAEVVSYPTAPGGDCTVRCKVCGHTETFATESKILAYRNYGGFGVYSEKASCDVGESIHFEVKNWDGEAFSDWELSVTDQDTGKTLEDGLEGVTVVYYGSHAREDGHILFSKPGNYKVVFTCRYNPKVTSRWLVTCSCEHQFGEWTSAGSIRHIRTCALCGETVSHAHAWGEGTLIEDPTGEGRDMKTFTCKDCGETKTVAAALGDLSGNGEIDATDYLLLKRYILGTFRLTDDQLAYADVNGDGEVNALDYMLVKRHVLGTYRIV